MIPQEIRKIYNILVSFLGESKNGLDDSLQLEFPCPRCREIHGDGENTKFNLSVSLKKQVFQCWKCCSHDDEMHGSIKKLFRLYGNVSLWEQYKSSINELKASRAFKLHFDKKDFEIDYSVIESNKLKLPPNFKFLVKKEKYPYQEGKALKYLEERGIGWDIINEYSIGYTEYDDKNKQASSRIVIPSYNEYGELNYWTGRDFTEIKGRQKYFNPKVERKSIIFNERRIQWDADITLVEGPFDSIVVPNSIPLLGKVLKKDFKLYQDLFSKAKANINILLDNDAFNDAIELYKKLNHGKLNGKIRIIPMDDKLDPSLVYQLKGKKGICKAISNSIKLKNEILL